MTKYQKIVHLLEQSVGHDFAQSFRSYSQGLRGWSGESLAFNPFLNLELHFRCEGTEMCAPVSRIEVMWHSGRRRRDDVYSAVFALKPTLLADGRTLVCISIHTPQLISDGKMSSACEATLYSLALVNQLQQSGVDDILQHVNVALADGVSTEVQVLKLCLQEIVLC